MLADLLMPIDREIGERDELLPFFKKNHQASLLFGMLAPDVGKADRLAFEFSIGGDFYADIVVGNSTTNAYAFIELESAKRQSIFRRTQRATFEWAAPFEHGFSQLVDWFRFVDLHKSTPTITEVFGNRELRYCGFLIIGRQAFLSPKDLDRLTWRAKKVLIDSLNINCLTYDGLLQRVQEKLTYYFEASKLS